MSLSPKSERLIAGLMIAGFVALSIGYSSGLLFEGPDELAHYRFIHDIFSLGPVPDRGPDPEWATYEYDQPPLYYLMQAALRQLAPDPDFADYEDLPRRFNSGGMADAHVPMSLQTVGWVGAENVNFWVHTPAEAFPYDRSGTALAVHLMRLFSVALGAGAAIACYGIFHVLWPDRPDRRLAALGLVAFWPTLQYAASVINNDVLITLTASLALWLLLRQMRDGPTWKGAGALGIMLGLALLSKATALILAAPVGLAVLLDWRRCWRYALLILGVAIAIAGWWYGYRAIVYHDPTGLNALTLDPITDPIGSAGFPPALIASRIVAIYRRLCARFGWGVIAPGQAIDMAFDLLTLAGVSGAVLKLTQTVRRAGWRAFFASIRVRQGLILAVFGAGLLTAVLPRVFTQWHGNQGRYLLPDIAGFAAVLAFGLDAWTPPRLRLRLSLSLALVMATVAVVCLFGVFWPAFRLPPAPTVIEEPLSLRYGATLELLGADRQTITAPPGNLVSLSLYWRALSTSSDDLSLDIHTSGVSLFVIEAPPARGLLLPSQWLPGQTWTERYALWIDRQAKPGVYRVYVLVVNRKTRSILPIMDTAGLPAPEPVAAEIVVR